MYDVTWGTGGTEQTVQCDSIEHARDAAAMVRAWGAVVAPAGECPWQRTARANGQPDAPRYTYPS